ncbi:HpcH/HpaI aldolase family protein [Agromyces sp. ZXT2-6]|uniref:HpcH/HpaI aldolase family protein n=1 Tax=Agromyces sp. ZXT2-6 TaxID=3461153 RepID=UPI00405520DF
MFNDERIYRMSRIQARQSLLALLEERTAVGTFVMSIDPQVTAAVGSAGVDFVIIDREHGPNDTQSTANHIRAAEANGVIPIVRVLRNDPAEIQATLDVGAVGVLVPKVGSAAQAVDLVRATKYAPGGRGMCPSVEAARWAFDDRTWDSHRESSNEQILMMPLIETGAGVRNLAEIVAVPGIDFVFFGIGDLAQDLGLHSMFNRESTSELARIWRESVEVVHAAGKKIGAMLSPDFPGADFGTVASDLSFLSAATRTAVNEVLTVDDVRAWESTLL